MILANKTIVFTPLFVSTIVDALAQSCLQRSQDGARFMTVLPDPVAAEMLLPLPVSLYFSTLFQNFPAVVSGAPQFFCTAPCIAPICFQSHRK